MFSLQSTALRMHHILTQTYCLGKHADSLENTNNLLKIRLWELEIFEFNYKFVCKTLNYNTFINSFVIYFDNDSFSIICRWCNNQLGYPNTFSCIKINTQEDILTMNVLIHDIWKSKVVTCFDYRTFYNAAERWREFCTLSAVNL